MERDKASGKALSALLQILRSNGVTRYVTPALTLELAPVAPRPAPRSFGVSPEALEAEAHGEDDDDEEEGDTRFLLERLNKRVIKRADPRRNAQ